MPIQSRYSNEEFEAVMQDVFVALEQNQSNRDLSIMVLGNVLANIFNNQVNKDKRQDMVEQFCNALKKSTSA
ncbi:DUF1414 domain-containing protein [Glaciecola sp. 2405UD65-10]|uniref:DUF1414 domain-containing protein n=1 Tax=Glaciecola sp. 2405UD65-10 TaxID=3397244 RepID=UPI003B58D300